MDKIDCIIFTKDRACQLDLLLRSISDNFINVGKVYVLYTYSNETFKRGYDKLWYNSPDYIFPITFTEQKNFQQDTLSIINRFTTPFYLGLCDDDVAIKQFDCSDIIQKLDEPNVNAISLKAGLNILGNYPQFVYPQPEFIETEPYLKWEWKRSHPESDWGYPTCINGYIFKKDYFLSLINQFDFDKPTNLEGGLNILKFQQMKSIMYSFKQSVLLNIPANRIQNESPNFYDVNHNYTAKDLNDKFLDGYRISTENIYNSTVRMGNEEREFIFEKQ